MGLFEDRPGQGARRGVPVWFMRQAGRYHAHFQRISAGADFMQMCKTPRLAADVTLGPIQDFGFDAAILFSDLLFPLEQLGFGLSYAGGPPSLGRHLDSLQTLKTLHPLAPAREYYAFQGEALKILRQELPSEVSLLGFVGGPFTLYTYACDGAHHGNLLSAKTGLFDGRFPGFMQLLLPELLGEMSVQAENGADTVCLFDTAVGELTEPHFKRFVVPTLRELTREFKQRHPDTRLLYYSKLTHMRYLRALEGCHIDVLGLDWRMDLPSALAELGPDYYVQGNFDPALLHLPWEALERELAGWWNSMRNLGPELLSKWVGGLGHGVIPQTPEENVRRTVEYVHRHFVY
jgi:uroporphyrinogen decarboxylase